MRRRRDIVPRMRRHAPPSLVVFFVAAASLACGGACGGASPRGVDAGDASGVTVDASASDAIALHDAGLDAGSVRAERYTEWRMEGLRAFEGDHVDVLPEGARLTPRALTGSDENGAYFYGDVVSPEVVVQHPFLELVPSWNVATPPGTWIEVRVRARVGATWTTD